MNVPPPPRIAMPPVPHLPPDIHDAAGNRSIQVIGDDGIERTEEAYLFWKSPNVKRAYQLWPNKPSLVLERRDEERGRILWAKVLLRDEERTDGRVVFRTSETNVVIKKLLRRFIDPLLQRQLQGGEPFNENPYAEISVMQQYGDDQHIVGCYEALQDPVHLYIVTLWARHGDLFHHICRGYPQSEVRSVARQLVRNLEFLQQNRLVHRDLKPENVVVAPPHVPFIDFAMTMQIPYLEGRPQMIESQGTVGSPYYISPEVLVNEPFDHKVDIWAFGMILFNLLTGMRLCELPWAADECFNFFIIQGGLEDEVLCDQILEELFQNGGEESLLSHLIQVVQVLDPEARNLLQKLLSRDPQNRPELDEIVNHPFFDGVV